MPLEGLRWSRDSGSALCDTSQNSRSRTGWGGVKLGVHCHVGQNVTFDTVAPSLFDIGDRVVITMNCVLLTHGFRTQNDGSKKWYVDKLTIGNDVFIGANTVIAKPLTIGNNVVIAAGSVVVNDVPSNCLVGGIPAKIIKRFN